MRNNVQLRFKGHALILKARLKPLAKKPPKGATIEANNPKAIACL